MNVLELMDETSAVLVAYRVAMPGGERESKGLLGSPEEGEAGEREKTDKIVVVVDMGETGLTVGVVAAREGMYVRLGAGRDDKLGGREFDNLVSFGVERRGARGGGGDDLIRDCSQTLTCMFIPDPFLSPPGHSSANTLPKSLLRKQRSHSRSHVVPTHLPLTSERKPNSVSPSNTPSDRSVLHLALLLVP